MLVVSAGELGVVVQQDDKQIVLSDVSGEKVVLREDIRKVESDTQENNLLLLAKNAEEKSLLDHIAGHRCAVCKWILVLYQPLCASAGGTRRDSGADSPGTGW